MTHDTLSSFRKLTLWLRLLIIIAVLMTIVEIVLAFFSDEPIALFVQGEVWMQEISSFGLVDRIVIFSILGVAIFLWMTVLYQFWRLCSLYRQNMIFTVKNAHCFIRIGWAMIGMAITDTLEIPLLGAYLLESGYIPAMPDMDAAFMFELDFLVAGLFFWLVAKIMERAAILQEEAALTV